MLTWTTVASSCFCDSGEAIGSEFPDIDLTCNFAIFDVDSKTKQVSEGFVDKARCLPRLAQILQASD